MLAIATETQSGRANSPGLLKPAALQSWLEALLNFDVSGCFFSYFVFLLFCFSVFKYHIPPTPADYAQLECNSAEFRGLITYLS